MAASDQKEDIIYVGNMGKSSMFSENQNFPMELATNSILSIHMYVGI